MDIGFPVGVLQGALVSCYIGSMSLGHITNINRSSYENFQKSGALIQTPNSRALINMTPRRKIPQCTETAISFIYVYVYIYIYMYIHMYVERGREREREADVGFGC